MNKVILTGRLCDTPELKYAGDNNSAVTSFTLAVKRDFKNPEGVYDCDFINCELWNKSAEIFCRYLSKGELVAIDGNLRLYKYLSSAGETKYKLIVKVNSFDFLSNNKKNSTKENIINADAIFDNEDSINGEISESEIPF